MVKQTVTERATSTAGNCSSSGDERNDSRFKGVRKRKWGKYVSEIRLPNSRERIWLGSYDTAEKAARAFDAALFCLRGRSAKFNFPDAPPEIAGGRSLTPAEIQAAAAKFANSEVDQRPPPSPSVSEPLNDASFMEIFNNVDSGYGLFPGFDDFAGEFFAPPFSAGDDYAAQEDIYFDAALPQESFLWNF